MIKYLIATPAYGGLLSTGYCRSAVQTKELFLKHKDILDADFYFLDNESLIQRGRNRCASYAIEKGYDRLLFIDADLTWTTDDITRLINTKVNVIGGTYPVKSLPIRINFNPIPSHINEHFAGSCGRSVDDFKAYREKCADENGEVQVMHVPTGFLQIDVAVLKKLTNVVEKYNNAGDINYNFFPCPVRYGILESEDWGFCSLCRDNGIPVFMNTNIVLTHAGTYNFKADLR